MYSEKFLKVLPQNLLRNVSLEVPVNILMSYILNRIIIGKMNRSTLNGTDVKPGRNLHYRARRSVDVHISSE